MYVIAHVHSSGYYLCNIIRWRRIGCLESGKTFQSEKECEDRASFGDRLGTTPANVGKMMICCRKRNHNVFVNAGCRVVKIGAWGIVVVKRQHVDALWPMANLGSCVFVNTMVSVNVRRCAVANGQPGVVCICKHDGECERTSMRCGQWPTCGRAICKHDGECEHCGQT
jgi:hypothetical protein